MGETFDVRYTEPVEGRRGNLDAPELAWEDTMKSVLAQGSPRTVALCGFANSSRHLAPYDDPDVEIWGCNEAAATGYMKTMEGKFRADRWFQVHTEEDWSRTNNPNDLRHLEWLEAQHNFPIYMQEKFDRVPNAVAIPREEMDEYFFGNVRTIDAWTGDTREWLDVYKHGYYTSTFAWMMAMAIFLGFEVIEIWGFNMGTKSEYMYQKPGGEFWVGQALARGIEVRIAGNSPIMKGHMYGFQVSDVLLPSQLTARIEELDAEYGPIKSEALQYHGARLELENMLEKEEFADKFEEIGERLVTRSQQELNTTCKVNFYQGAINESRQYRRHLDARHEGVETGWVDRLTMEVRKTVLRNEIDDLRSAMNHITGAKAELKLIQEMHETLDLSDRFLELQNKEIDWANRLSYNLGAISQNEYYITQSEGRNPNMSDEHEYGYLIVPDLFPDESDVLDWNIEGVDNDETTQETTKQEADEGSTAGDPELPGEPAQRPIDPSLVRGPADGEQRGGSGNWVSATEGATWGESG
jgi:hypothetical protein